MTGSELEEALRKSPLDPRVAQVAAWIDVHRDELASRGLLSRGEGGRELHLEQRLADALAATID